MVSVHHREHPDHHSCILQKLEENFRYIDSKLLYNIFLGSCVNIPVDKINGVTMQSILKVVPVFNPFNKSSC